MKETKHTFIVSTKYKHSLNMHTQQAVVILISKSGLSVYFHCGIMNLFIHHNMIMQELANQDLKRGPINAAFQTTKNWDFS